MRISISNSIIRMKTTTFGVLQFRKNSSGSAYGAACEEGQRTARRASRAGLRLLQLFSDCTAYGFWCFELFFRGYQPRDGVPTRNSDGVPSPELRLGSV